MDYDDEQTEAIREDVAARAQNVLDTARREADGLRSQRDMLRVERAALHEALEWFAAKSFCGLTIEADSVDYRSVLTGDWEPVAHNRTGADIARAIVEAARLAKAESAK